MDDAVRAALGHSQAVDITTTGARTGLARRIEIFLHSFDGRLFISGVPNPVRKRSWLANLEANPAFTLHLKRPVQAELPATARVIRDPAERAAILAKVAQAWHRSDIGMMVEHSPLIEVSIEGDVG